jgi:hypothetical protein
MVHGVRSGRTVEREASYGLQAGLLSMALIGVTLVTFGRFFYLSLAYVLMSGAGGLALLSGRWADRSMHAAARGTRVRRDAQIARLLSIVALLFVVYYSGLWIFLAVSWPVVLFLGLIAWSLHRSRVEARASSREAGA